MIKIHILIGVFIGVISYKNESKITNNINLSLKKAQLLMSNQENSISTNLTVKDTLTKKIEVHPFGNIDSKQVFLYTLKNSNGISLKVTNYGGIITSLLVPNKNGIKENIVLGFDSLEDYIEYPGYFGAIVGRFCNRIAKGKFTLNAKEYQLSTNENENHIHGGVKGFNKVIWEVKPIEGENFVGLELTYLSKDLDEGYPGNLKVKVTYKLTELNELKVEYKATTDKETIVNLTQHSYFNLSGNVKETVLDHHLKINATSFLPINSNLIPIGNIKAVENTPFNFSEFTKIGKNINKENTQLQLASGYDHTFVLNKENGNLAATVFDEESGRQMEVYTTKPGVQLYTGNFLSRATKNNNNIIFKNNEGLCLETQFFPNSPNEPSFPSATLLPTEVYSHSTTFKFSIKTN